MWSRRQKDNIVEQRMSSSVTLEQHTINHGAYDNIRIFLQVPEAQAASMSSEGWLHGS